VFMETNEITFDCQSRQSKAANNNKSPVSDAMDLVKVCELAKKPGSTLKSMAASLGVGYSTVRSFTIRYQISVANRMPSSRSMAKFLKVDDIRTKAAVEGASIRGIAKASNVSVQTIVRFMKKHSIELKKRTTRQPI